MTNKYNLQLQHDKFKNYEKYTRFYFKAYFLSEIISMYFIKNNQSPKSIFRSWLPPTSCLTLKIQKKKKNKTNSTLFISLSIIADNTIINI